MKRRFTLITALVLSIGLVSLTASDSFVQAQQGGSLRGAIYDTGIVALGPNQVLRITVNGMSGDDSLINARFREMKYGQQSCNNGVCRSLVTNEVLKDVTFDAQSQSVWIDIDRTPGESGVRGIVVSRRPVRVNAQIIDTTTGEVQGIIAILIG